MPISRTSHGDQAEVSANAVVRADNQGITSLMDRLGRLVSRQEYGQQVMVALQASVEQAIRELSRPFKGKPGSIHAWFTIGAREIAVRLENEVPSGQRTLACPQTSPSIPPEFVACAALCALQLIHYRADNWSFSMAWRRIPSKAMSDLPVGG